MSTRLNVAVECVVDARNTTGESPLWSERDAALYWVDIPAGQILRWLPTNGERRTWKLPAAVGSIGLAERGGLVVAMRTGFHLFDLETERLTFLCHPEPDIATNRLNDGKVSPEGRFWAGTMDERPEKEPIGSLYRLDADHRCTRMANDVKVSNGLAWSPDGRTMYHSDSRGGAIFRYNYDPETGSIGKRELFVSMQSEWGRPDGGATDEEGCYWGCGICCRADQPVQSGGGTDRIRRNADYAPDDALLRWIRRPHTVRDFASREPVRRRARARRRWPVACSCSSRGSRAHPRHSTKDDCDDQGCAFRRRRKHGPDSSYRAPQARCRPALGRGPETSRAAARGRGHHARGSARSCRRRSSAQRRRRADSPGGHQRRETFARDHREQPGGAAPDLRRSAAQQGAARDLRQLKPRFRHALGQGQAQARRAVSSRRLLRTVEGLGRGDGPHVLGQARHRRAYRCASALRWASRRPNSGT